MNFDFTRTIIDGIKIWVKDFIEEKIKVNADTSKLYTDEQISSHIHSYDDLTDKPDISSIEEKISNISNDVKEKADLVHTHVWDDITDRPFYEEIGFVSVFDEDITMVYPDTVIEELDSVYYFDSPLENFTDGERYRVVMNGTIDDEPFYRDEVLTAESGTLTVKSDWEFDISSNKISVTENDYCFIGHLYIAHEEEVVNHIDEKYIPDTIARVSDIPEGFSGSWNDLTEKPFGIITHKVSNVGFSEDDIVANDMVKVSDEVIPPDCFPDAIMRLHYGDQVTDVRVGDESYYLVDTGAWNEFLWVAYKTPFVPIGGVVIKEVGIYLPAVSAFDVEVEVLWEETKNIDSTYIGDDIARIADMPEIVNVDATLSVAGSAADAKAVGDLLDTKADIVMLDNYYLKSEANTLHTEIKDYVDTEVAALVNSAPETLDTLGELAVAFEENKDMVQTLDEAITDKQDKITDTLVLVDAVTGASYKIQIQNGQLVSFPVEQVI